MATKRRTIFEEVEAAGRPAASPGGIGRGRSLDRSSLRLWLALLFALVVAMIVVGGLTRLTDSGLSITRWDLVTGTLPPRDADAWQAELDAYRATPQYDLVNRGMTMDEFRLIYWWEWGHRALGRLIGAVFLVGAVGLAATRRVPPGWTGRLVAIGALIGLQGAIGWWMVRSGLEDGMVSVASTRLAVHLGLAFVILGLLAWSILLASRGETVLMTARRQTEPRLLSVSTGLMHLLFLQIVLGALVAGIDAGRAFPTWPGMGGGFLPPDPFSLDPWWRNFVEDPGLVQFVHRMTGYLVAILAIVVFVCARRSPHASTRAAFAWVLGAVALQVALGIGAVLSQATLPVAIAHQAAAILLWALVIRGRFLAGYPVAGSLRARA